MSGINALFTEEEYTDHGQVNEEYFGPLEDNNQWTCTMRLVEVPLEEEHVPEEYRDDLFVLLKEQSTHTKLKGAFLGNPMDEETETQRLGGGHIGGHIREDNVLSIGTPYKRFSKQLAYVASYQYLNDRGGMRVDEIPEDADLTRSGRTEAERCLHRVHPANVGKETWHGDTSPLSA